LAPPLREPIRFPNSTDLEELQNGC
jgi:hypothetical protein